MDSCVARLFAMIIGLSAVVYSLFLTYKILGHIQATELMWFVFWTYVPVLLVGAALANLLSGDH